MEAIPSSRVRTVGLADAEMARKGYALGTAYESQPPGQFDFNGNMRRYEQFVVDEASALPQTLEDLIEVGPAPLLLNPATSNPDGTLKGLSLDNIPGVDFDHILPADRSGRRRVETVAAPKPKQRPEYHGPERDERAAFTAQSGAWARGEGRQIVDVTPEQEWQLMYLKNADARYRPSRVLLKAPRITDDERFQLFFSLSPYCPQDPRRRGGSRRVRRRPCHGRTTHTVRLTWGLNGLNLIAEERGAFEKLLAKDGIKVEWLGPFSNHAPTMQAVTGGSADFSFGGSTTPALAAIIAGSPLVFTQFVVYEPRTTAISAKDSSGIAGVKDLAGKSVAVYRSGLGEFLLVAALEKHGVDRSAVKFVYLNPPDAAPALASGKVDAWSMWSPGVDIARAEYQAHDLFLERDLEFQIDYTSYLTTRTFAETNPDLVRAVNAAFQAEAAWVSANTVEAEGIAQKKVGYSDVVRDRFIGLKRQYRVHPVTDQAFLADLQRVADWLTAHKVLPEAVKVADHLAKL